MKGERGEATVECHADCRGRKLVVVMAPHSMSYWSEDTRDTQTETGRERETKTEAGVSDGLRVWRLPVVIEYLARCCHRCCCCRLHTSLSLHAGALARSRGTATLTWQRSRSRNRTRNRSSCQSQGKRCVQAHVCVRVCGCVCVCMRGCLSFEFPFMHFSCHATVNGGVLSRVYQ